MLIVLMPPKMTCAFATDNAPLTPGIGVALAKCLILSLSIRMSISTILPHLHVNLRAIINKVSHAPGWASRSFAKAVVEQLRDIILKSSNATVLKQKKPCSATVANLAPAHFSHGATS
jgi:hypothetical protein